MGALLRRHTRFASLLSSFLPKAPRRLFLHSLRAAFEAAGPEGPAWGWETTENGGGASHSPPAPRYPLVFLPPSSLGNTSDDNEIAMSFASDAPPKATNGIVADSYAARFAKQRNQNLAARRRRSTPPTTTVAAGESDKASKKNSHGCGGSLTPQQEEWLSLHDVRASSSVRYRSHFGGGGKGGRHHQQRKSHESNAGQTDNKEEEKLGMTPATDVPSLKLFDPNALVNNPFAAAIAWRLRAYAAAEALTAEAERSELIAGALLDALLKNNNNRGIDSNPANKNEHNRRGGSSNSGTSSAKERATNGAGEAAATTPTITLAEDAFGAVPAVPSASAPPADYGHTKVADGDGGYVFKLRKRKRRPPHLMTARAPTTTTTTIATKEAAGNDSEADANDNNNNNNDDNTPIRDTRKGDTANGAAAQTEHQQQQQLARRRRRRMQRRRLKLPIDLHQRHLSSPDTPDGAVELVRIYQEFAPPYPAPWEHEWRHV